MSQELELIVQKSNTLKDYYIATCKAKIANVLLAQQTIDALPIPTTEADITKTELALADAKKVHKGMVEDTVAKKAPFNNFLSSLDEPHKTLYNERTENGKKIKEGHIATVEVALLELKKAQAIRIEAERKKAEDRQLYGSRLKRDLIDRSTAKKVELMGWVKKAFEFALDKIEPATIDAYIAKCKERKPKDAFLYHDGLTSPTNDPELESIYNTTLIEHLPSPEGLKAEFDSEIDLAFVDFANAKKNIELAKTQLAQEQEVAKVELHEATNEAIVSEMFASASQVPVIEVVGKALKKKQILDMPDNYDTVRAIMMAYASNTGKVESKLLNKSPLGTTIKQIATAIEKLNNDGIIFNGLTFKDEFSL
jgi:hypothetical protein